MTALNMTTAIMIKGTVMTQCRNRDYWLKALSEGYEIECRDGVISRMVYLGEQIFQFTTYDSVVCELFAGWALEVVEAIHTNSSLCYIEKSDEHYQRYLLMCNLPFFSEKINWGTSIRCAFWDHSIFEIDSCGLWYDDSQLLNIKVTHKEWLAFADAVLEFARKEVEQLAEDDSDSFAYRLADLVSSWTMEGGNFLMKEDVDPLIARARSDRDIQTEVDEVIAALPKRTQSTSTQAETPLTELQRLGQEFDAANSNTDALAALDWIVSQIIDMCDYDRERLEIIRAALTREAPDHREAVTQWLSAFGMVAIDKEELSELQRTREAEAVPVGWQARLKPDGDWHPLLEPYVEKRISDPEFDVRPVYDHPAPARFPSREELARTLCKAECGGPIGYFADGSPMRSGGNWEEYTNPDTGQLSPCQEVWLEMADAVISLLTQGEAQTTNDGVLRDALQEARAYVLDAVNADGGIDSCEISHRATLERIDAALSNLTNGEG